MGKQDYIKGGGTSSSANDQMKARERADAERRRAEYDKQQAVLARSTTETKRAGGEMVVKTTTDPEVQHYAAQYTRNLGGMSDHAAVVLRVDEPDGSVLDYIMCNLIVHDAALGVFHLVMVCPSCLHRHGKSLTESHITLRSNHRRFSLHERHRGELWVNPKPPHEVLTLAGSIDTHETQTCPTCAYKFEIGAAKPEPGRPVVSGVVRSV